MSSCSTWGGLKSERLFFAPADIAGLFFWCEYSSSLFASSFIPPLPSYLVLHLSFPIILWSLSFSLFPSLAFSLFLWTTYYPAESKGIGQLCIQTWMTPNRYIYSKHNDLSHWSTVSSTLKQSALGQDAQRHRSWKWAIDSLSCLPSHATGACKIHSWHSHCSSVRLNGPSCVALSFRRMMSVYC